jgi:hypothetical protein
MDIHGQVPDASGLLPFGRGYEELDRFAHHLDHLHETECGVLSGQRGRIGCPLCSDRANLVQRVCSLRGGHLAVWVPDGCRRHYTPYQALVKPLLMAGSLRQGRSWTEVYGAR